MGVPAETAPPGAPRWADTRAPPHNLDAERSIIGSMLLSRDAIAEVSEFVSAGDFYRGAHRTMFEVARGLYDRGEPVDSVTLSDELARRELLEDVGGAAEVADLLAGTPTAANAAYYARIVADHGVRRRLIDAGTRVAQLGYESEGTVSETVDAAESEVFGVAQSGRTEDFSSMKELLTQSFEIIEALHESDSDVTGVATGFTDFDTVTSGLQEANLVIVAARPAMGKSTLVTNLATHVAAELRRPAVMFSLEMSKLEVTQRILSSEARVDSERLRTGKLKDNDWPRLSQAMGRLAEAPLFIDDTPGISLMEIRSKCRRLAQRHGLDLVVVDYLQLMQPHKTADNRVQEVSEISRGLKLLAKELSVPVVALSQLSRRPEDRTDRRPQLADLRESGSIEQDADLVAFIYREEVYDPESAAKGEAELILAKHRNGPLANVRLSFLGRHTRFANMAHSGQRQSAGEAL